jgi:hypothetical protein
VSILDLREKVILRMTRGQANRKVFPKRLTARVAALACAILMTGMLSALNVRAQNAGGPPPPPAASPQGTADIVAQENVKAKTTLRGHVSYEGTGKPVRRARLILLARNNRGAEVTGITNARGEFQIKNVPEGKYFIMVDAAGIVTPISLIDIESLNSDKVDYEEIGKQFEEVSIDGINDKEVEVHARRGGAISGRITYQDGDPAINVQVVIMRRRNGELKPFFTSLSASALFGYRTDDRGAYRFAGLPPGEYVVGATENIEHGDARRNSDDEFMGGAMLGGNSLVMTYYQDATNARNATSIQIASGEEEKNVDITLAERALHMISGTVKARNDGRPLAHARVSLTSKENNSVFNQVVPFSEFLPASETDEMGQWSFNEIPDGNYVITVQPAYEAPETMSVTPVESQEAPARILSHNKKKFSQKQQDVKVAGHDVTNLVVEMAEGARVSGTVTVEGGKPVPGGLFISIQPSDEQPAPTAPTVLSPNGNFILDGLPSGKLNIFVYTPENKYYVKSIIAGGVDLLREPLLVQESVEIKGVRVVLSTEGGTLTGHVLNGPGGPPLSNTRIVLYPVDPALWTRPGRVIFDGTDETGAFNVSGAPGEYLFVVMRNGESAQLLNEEFVKSRAATATHVTLLANEPRSIEVIAPGVK